MKKIMKNVNNTRKSFYKRLLIISLLILWVNFIKAQNDILLEKIKHNAVKLISQFGEGEDQAEGWGFVIGERDDALYIVTARHVVWKLNNSGFKKANSVGIKFFTDQGEYYSTVTILDILGLMDLSNSNTDLDLALIRLPEKPINFNLMESYISYSVEEGQQVWFMSDNWKYTQSPGVIYNVEDNEIEIEGSTIHPGNSGGPLITENGIVGLIFEDSNPYAKSIHIEKIRQIITEMNYPWLEPHLVFADELFNLGDSLFNKSQFHLAMVKFDSAKSLFQLAIEHSPSSEEFRNKIKLCDEKINLSKNLIENLDSAKYHSSKGEFLTAKSFLSKADSVNSSPVLDSLIKLNNDSLKLQKPSPIDDVAVEWQPGKNANRKNVEANCRIENPHDRPITILVWIDIGYYTRCEKAEDRWVKTGSITRTLNLSPKQISEFKLTKDDVRYYSPSITNRCTDKKVSVTTHFSDDL